MPTRLNDRHNSRGRKPAAALVQARLSIREAMTPMFRAAKANDFVLCSRVGQREAFTPQRLMREMAHGVNCWGPRWWYLRPTLNAQHAGFLIHD